MPRLIRGALLALLATPLLAACEEEVVRQETVRPVRAVQVADSTAFARTSLPGRAKAVQEVNLSFRVAGPLITRPVEVGDEVRAGQVLATIDPRDFEVNLRNTEAQLERARSELAAMREARPEDIRRLQAAVEKAQAAVGLADQELARVQRIQREDPGAISQEMIDRRVEQKTRADAELRNAVEELRIGQRGARPEDIAAKEAEIASLQASVEAAGDELSYTYLEAPFEGTIVATHVENFEYVQARQPVMRLLDTSRIELVVDVPESKISGAPYVKNIRVVFDAFPGVEIPAEIKEIGKEASQTTRTYPVTLVMDQPEGVTVLPGMAGRASAERRSPEECCDIGIQIPVSAVFSPDDSGASYVWVIDDGTAKRRDIKTGKLTGLGVVVEEGLSPGEWIATAGVHTLREGQQVRILEEAGS